MVQSQCNIHNAQPQRSIMYSTLELFNLTAPYETIFTYLFTQNSSI